MGVAFVLIGIIIVIFMGFFFLGALVAGVSLPQCWHDWDYSEEVTINQDNHTILTLPAKRVCKKCGLTETMEIKSKWSETLGDRIR
jgi:hypothetical protein